MTEYLDRYPTMHEYAEGKRINPKLTDLISRADAIAYIERVINSGLGRNKSLDYIHKYISALPSADAVDVNDVTIHYKPYPSADRVGLRTQCKSVRIVETGEVFPSLGECARAIGGDVGNISRCLNTDKSDTHKGFHFERVV